MRIHVEVVVGNEAEVLVRLAVEVEHDTVTTHESRVIADRRVATALGLALFLNPDTEGTRLEKQLTIDQVRVSNSKPQTKIWELFVCSCKHITSKSVC
jgi:hypothetical protein